MTENNENESILIFHSCSSNLNVGENKLSNWELESCLELHIGNTPRSIMTKGISVTNGTQYGNFIRGNKDKLMISYMRESSHDYTMVGASGVLFEGEIHFFGGLNYTHYIGEGMDFTRQHFVIETKRSGQLVKITKKEDLDIPFRSPYCSSFEMTAEYFTWSKTNAVILCFDFYHERSCYSFNGKLNYIGDSNYDHALGLARYKSNLLTLGGYYSEEEMKTVNQETVILTRDKNKNFSWSVVEPVDFKFTPGKYITGHSMVTVEPSDINEEYVLFLGGHDYLELEIVFKFNGTWFPFGKLKKRRYWYNTIYWNGAVYVIGGHYDNIHENGKTKMEIWNIKDSPDQFKTKENWPELFYWMWPHLFIVPESFFPDH